MSQWTHVAIVIRTDAILGINKNALERAMGCTCSYDDDERVWELAHQDLTPCGSEGSLQWKYDPAGAESSSLSQGWIVIWGDLRHYSDAPAIVNWLESKLKLLDAAHIWARQVSGTIEVEYAPYIQMISRVNDKIVVHNEPVPEEKECP